MLRYLQFTVGQYIQPRSFPAQLFRLNRDNTVKLVVNMYVIIKLFKPGFINAYENRPHTDQAEPSTPLITTDASISATHPRVYTVPDCAFSHIV